VVDREAGFPHGTSADAALGDIDALAADHRKQTL
jgi:hypothetical protein